MKYAHYNIEERPHPPSRASCYQGLKAGPNKRIPYWPILLIQLRL